MAMIAMGYPGKVEDLPDELRKRETAPRTRKPIEEVAFAGKWGEPFRS